MEDIEEVYHGKLQASRKKMLAPYENVLETLEEVPSLRTKSIEDLITEIGLDMSVFPDEKHFASWCGVAPGNNESAGKKVDAPRMVTNK